MPLLFLCPWPLPCHARAILAHGLQNFDADQDHENLTELQRGVGGIVKHDLGEGVGHTQGNEQQAHAITAHHPKAMCLEVAQPYAPERQARRNDPGQAVGDGGVEKHLIGTQALDVKGRWATNRSRHQIGFSNRTMQVRAARAKTLPELKAPGKKRDHAACYMNEEGGQKGSYMIPVGVPRIKPETFIRRQEEDKKTCQNNKECALHPIGRFSFRGCYRHIPLSPKISPNLCLLRPRQTGIVLH